MYRFLLIGLTLAVITGLSGCATPQKVLEVKISALQNRVSVLEEELAYKQQENLNLKENILALEDDLGKRTIRMPVGKEIQIALRNAGFYQGKIDGQIGQQTKEAVRKFQEANGLNPDGVIGSRTWKSLNKYLKPQIKQESVGEIESNEEINQKPIIEPKQEE